MKIEAVVHKHSVVNQKAYVRFKGEMARMQLGTDALKDNYLPHRLKLEDHQSYDLLVSDADELLCASGMLNRPQWGEGVFRISNRTYVPPEQRSHYYSFLNPQYIGYHQIKRHRDECKFVFISREDPKGRGYFKILQRRVPFYLDWTISDQLVQVVPGGTTRSSYQYIIYRYYAKMDFPFKSITEEEWHELPY